MRAAPFPGSLVAPLPAPADSRRVLRRTPLLLAALLLLPACSGFREVVPGVYRSPQPNEDQLFRRIAAYDLRTVVCLRGRSHPSAASERATVGAGARFLAVPTTSGQSAREPLVVLPRSLAMKDLPNGHKARLDAEDRLYARLKGRLLNKRRMELDMTQVEVADESSANGVRGCNGTTLGR